MENSILTSIKKLLGIAEEYTHFDTDIIIHINSVFPTLRRLGVGPEEGYKIEDKSNTWDEFIPADSTEFESVKTYIYLKVRLVFDPPSNSTVISSMKEIIAETEWRLNDAAEHIK